MLKQLPKVLLLVALLAAFAVSSIPAFGTDGATCKCLTFKAGGGGCHFDKKTSQCVNTGCKTGCLLI